ncbi:MAG TPA: vitamin B12 dependent-methionine synthase activation domain-containing protein [Gemmatimonadaceae bacterium]|nr:vitamin B12 dependent-methionine synthase activation domain-containing protein [Gemmatimonadaceae bacterium]
MRHEIEFTTAECSPDLETLVRAEVGPDTQIPDRLLRLFEHAMHAFVRLAEPRAIVAEVSKGEFYRIYKGEGLNAAETPLEVIVPRSGRLALFAATVGARTSAEIPALFARGEPALGYTLDVIASDAANRLADQLAQRFRESLQAPDSGAAISVLPYSPGYCGWHVSGQRRLFEHLHPESIGITLTGSFLMQPLKSVSGVLVSGAPEAHRFKPTYVFCDDCTTHECRGRMASVLKRGRR